MNENLQEELERISSEIKNMSKQQKISNLKIERMKTTDPELKMEIARMIEEVEAERASKKVIIAVAAVVVLLAVWFLLPNSFKKNLFNSSNSNQTTTSTSNSSSSKASGKGSSQSTTKKTGSSSSTTKSSSTTGSSTTVAPVNPESQGNGATQGDVGAQGNYEPTENYETPDYSGSVGNSDGAGNSGGSGVAGGGEADSTLWNTSKESKLQSFMDSWGAEMGQQYEEYSPSNNVNFYGVSAPGSLLDGKATNVAVNGRRVAIQWSKDGTQKNIFNLVAVYSDINSTHEGEKHLYFFAIVNDEPVVIVTSQTQGNDKNLLYFKYTANEVLYNGFSRIVNN